MTIIDTSIHSVDLLVPPRTLFPLIRHLSYRLTPVLLRWRVTPNQITLGSLLLGVCGAALFIVGAQAAGICGGLFLVASYTLDNCDGEVARIRNMASEFGARFDDIADSIVDASFFAALGYGTFRSTGQNFWLWLGFAAAFGAAFDYVVDFAVRAREKRRNAAPCRHEQAINSKLPCSRIDWIIFILKGLSRADFALIVLVLALFDIVYLLLPCAAVGAQIFWVSDLFERTRGFHA